VKVRYHGVPGIGSKLLRARQRESKPVLEGHWLHEKGELQEYVQVCRVSGKLSYRGWMREDKEVIGQWKSIEIGRGHEGVAMRCGT
jgi:hypothetical protein